MSDDAQARRIEQLERDLHLARRTIEKICARLERVEAQTKVPRMIEARPPVGLRPDPLGR